MNGFSKDKLLTKDAKKARCSDMCPSFPPPTQMSLHYSNTWLSYMCFFLYFFNKILEINFICFFVGKKMSDIIRKKWWTRQDRFLCVKRKHKKGIVPVFVYHNLSFLSLSFLIFFNNSFCCTLSSSGFLSHYKGKDWNHKREIKSILRCFFNLLSDDEKLLNLNQSYFSYLQIVGSKSTD